MTTANGVEPSVGRRVCHVANALFLVATFVYLFTVTKGLPVLQYFWSRGRYLHPGDFTLSSSSNSISLNPIIIVLTVALSVWLLSRAYENVDMFYFGRRMITNSLNASNNSGAELERKRIVKWISRSAINYSFFYANAIAAFVFLVLSHGVLQETPTFYNFVLSTLGSTALTATLTKRH